MPLANYSDLQASIASHIDRTDQTSNIPDFVVIAESYISQDLRLRKQITVTTLSTVASQDYVALPTDWLEFLYIKLSGSPLCFETGNTIRAANERTGDLRYYSIEGERLLLNPTPGAVSTLDVAYYAKIAALATTPTNFLLTSYPQIYLYKSLGCAYKFLMDDQRAQYWDNLYYAEVKRVQDADKRSLHSGSPLTVRPR